MSAKAKVKRLVELGEFDVVVEIPPLFGQYSDLLTGKIYKGGSCSPLCPKNGELLPDCEWSSYDKDQDDYFPTQLCPRYGTPFGNEDDS